MSSFKGKVSIIVPVYNSAKFLDRCVRSILSQTYDNLEILLIDDGSSDDSPAICDSFSKEDNRVVVVHKRNEGVSSARNTGIEIASGEYVGFVDADDYIEQTMYEELVSKIYFNEIKNDIVICNINRVSGENKVAFSYPISDGVYSKEELINELMKPQSLEGFSFIKLFEKKKLYDDKVFFPTDLCYMEDVLFTYKYLLSCQYGYIMSKPLYNYCINPSSVTQQRKFPVGTLKVFDKMETLTTDSVVKKQIDLWRCAIITIQLAKKRSIKGYELPDDFPNLRIQKQAVWKFFFDKRRSLKRRVYYILLIAFPFLRSILERMKGN